MLSPEHCQLLLTSEEGGDAIALEILRDAGLSDAEAGLRRLRGMVGSSTDAALLAQALPALLVALSDAATPDGSLMNFERLTQAVPNRSRLFRFLAEQPRAVEILVRLFVGSQFLTEILLRSPQYLEQLVEHRRIAEFKSREELFADAQAAAASAASYADKLNALRRFQQWELLRLSACDAFGLMDLKTVTLELALLADSLIQSCLLATAEDLRCDCDDFCVLAFGKLGGEELNYSSDIDLVFVCESGAERYWELGQRLIRALTEPTPEGFFYRVDMRLRPWGKSGPLVSTLDAYADYLRDHGRLWEQQAHLKARPVAGKLAIGAQLLRRIEPTIFSVSPDDLRREIGEMKRRMESRLDTGGRDWGEVKTGRGGIREIEFVTQYLQLANGGAAPAVRSANTLDGLVRLADQHVLHAEEYRQLSGGYVVLRTIEHALQRLHNRQSHSLPVDQRELEYLARRLDFPGAGEFVEFYEQHRRTIRRVFERRILEVHASSPQSDPAAIQSVEAHLGDAARTYSEQHSPAEQERHLTLLARLDVRHPVRTECQPLADDAWELVIVGYDQLGHLSLMCGLLIAYGWNIDSGFVLTGSSIADQVAGSQRTDPDPSPRKFINVFRIRPAAGTNAIGEWDQYEEELLQTLALPDRGPAAAERGRLARRVATTIDSVSNSVGALLPVEIGIDNRQVPDATVMHIRAEDTPGFLYELASALALHGVSIRRVWIQSEGRQIVDTLWVVDSDGQKIVDTDRLNELRAAVVLIKHFTHLLPRSSNPESALLHFREFVGELFRRPGWVQDLSQLQNSEVLAALTRLLGVSDFLWHDFLRLQHSHLFPVVADLSALQTPRTHAQLTDELRQLLSSASTKGERRDALNLFKDQEALRIDMRHILGLQDQFGMFSRELTDLAEVVVAGAFWICLEELTATFGSPRTKDGAVCGVSVGALGKCGGRELGFASDIELMFVYAEDGETDGTEVISNAEFFQRLVEQFRKCIRAKREGIFEIDLRLRPYGKAGSLAVSLEAFEKYFGHDGPAWPYERQSLVKLRPIAGDPIVGERMTAVRNRICYSGRPFEVAAMRGLREKQLRQLVRAGEFNAKLSAGGLVDCEYLVQGLQITFGHLRPELHATNTRAALRALEAIGLLTSEERLRLRDAYRFLRRLIDALRMVRGDARDLTVPPTSSDEFLFLARRLEYPDAAQLRHDLERYTADVVEFSRLLDDLPALEQRLVHRFDESHST